VTQLYWSWRLESVLLVVVAAVKGWVVLPQLPERRQARGCQQQQQQQQQQQGWQVLPLDLPTSHYYSPGQLVRLLLPPLQHQRPPPLLLPLLRLLPLLHHLLPC
jgi:hypothetical protein